ncbi:hypothetical protein [Bartonella sp. CB169]|uniref:hypothetical protein n=1 Tax=Bartonella sp. CB169 TaxID=3112257 RepID=UPI00300E2C10
MRSIFYFVLILFLSIGKQSLGSEPEVIQKVELLRLVADINNAVKNRDFAVISLHMPKRLYKEMARRLNTTEKNLRDSFIKQLSVQFENLSLDAYHLDEKNIAYLQSNSGILYALIPTTLKTKDRIIQYKTLAIFDKTQWYLIYGGQKTIQNPIFLEIYPDFNNVQLPNKIIIKH